MAKKLGSRPVTGKKVKTWRDRVEEENAGQLEFTVARADDNRLILQKHDEPSPGDLQVGHMCDLVTARYVAALVNRAIHKV